ncbi:MAG: metal-dependent transcriptional regulator [Candidatus Heimdallarchaeota archaeon]
MSTKKSVDVITSTIEDYLECILVLSEKGELAHVTDIAKELEVRKASVTEMIIKLEKFGFVDYEKYSPIQLTEKGKKIAESVKERHEMLRAFLLLIGVNNENANNDCCVMEHNLSKDTVEKLTSFIDFLEEEDQRDIIERFKKYNK